jgi:hypothetical protein
MKKCIAEVDEQMEKQLLNKSYYESYMEGHEGMNPYEVLGDAYMEEQGNEVPELARIRFAQGELYYRHKDYEAAIFKWENIHNEFEPWAQKNMADAYFELDLLSMAEDIYKTIETDSNILKIEVLLQLFSLYIQRGKLELAVEAVKKAVVLDPDYPDVTEVARRFFEEHQDWGNALELAVEEAIRTRSVSWFEVLGRYIADGKAKQLEPSYYNNALMVLFEVDKSRFEEIAAALFHQYKNSSEIRFAWLKELNYILLHGKDADDYTWNLLSDHYYYAYTELISGKYLVREMAHLMPNTLKNWLNIASPLHEQLASSAVLAWNELFPADLDEETIYAAEKTISHHVNSETGAEPGFVLFENIMSWAGENGVLMGERFKWMVRELLNMDGQHLLVTGLGNSLALDFLKKITSVPLTGDYQRNAMMLKHSENNRLTAIIDENIVELNTLEEVKEHNRDMQQMIVDLRMPIPFLRQNQTAIIHAKDHGNVIASDLHQYLHFADNLLFVVDARQTFSENEMELVERVQEKAPNLPIHFLLLLQEEFDAEIVAEKAVKDIYSIFPHASVFTFSLPYEGNDQLEELGLFLRQMNNSSRLEEERTKKVLYYIKKSINFLLDKRTEKEKSYIEQISWNEEMQTKLKGAIHQLEDTEEGKVRIITAAFNQLKNDMKAKMKAKLPQLFKQSAELITENSNFGNIHIELNDEMNRKAQEYIELEILPEFYSRFKDWIISSEGELTESQRFLDNIAESFNEMYDKERLKLVCDFKVLDDWARDADRMTRGTARLDPVNILLKFTPSQFLLKSAGKLFGGLQNKAILHNRYIQFIENDDYHDVTNLITERVMQQFDLFERALERDIKMFFKQPFDALHDAVEETRKTVDEKSFDLEQMRKHPELFRDPLTLFDLRLRQCEWMNAEHYEKIQSL